MLRRVKILSDCTVNGTKAMIFRKEKKSTNPGDLENVESLYTSEIKLQLIVFRFIKENPQQTNKRQQSIIFY